MPVQFVHRFAWCEDGPAEHHLVRAAVGTIDEELDGHVHPAVVGRQSRVGGEVGDVHLVAVLSHVSVLGRRRAWVDRLRARGPRQGGAGGDRRRRLSPAIDPPTWVFDGETAPGGPHPETSRSVARYI